MHKNIIVAIFVIALLIPGTIFAQGDEPITLTLVTHDSFAIAEEVLDQFSDETGINVEILRSGDAGSMVNQSILTAENPLGDVMYGVDNTFLSRALDAELFIPYESPMLEYVIDEFIIDDQHRVTPINYGDVCINYDVSYFEDNAIALPDSLLDLTDPAHRATLVVESPATSSPGLAFLLATIAEFGDDPDSDYTYLTYWEELVMNNALVVDDWTNAYYGQFSGSYGDGSYPLVVSYASSPPAEVFFAEEPLDSAPTGSLIAQGMCFRQIEFAGIIEGTEHEEAAQQLIDFMLGIEFQQDIPLQMFVFPVNAEAELPEVFAEYAQIPDEPVYFPYEIIGEHREEWIQAWIETVLR